MKKKKKKYVVESPITGVLQVHQHSVVTDADIVTVSRAD